MDSRSYVGIDKTDTQEWIVVIWEQGVCRFSSTFPDTASAPAAILDFICRRCDKPKVCVNPGYPGSFNLIAHLSCIPGAEVILLSKAGLSLHLNWLPKSVNLAAANAAQSQRAVLLAGCAERMI
ncbi:hypothetical protein KEF85_07605 [Methylomonas paludis]|uniref:Uncharacterized protein n=1 Tax=Methylomonas paludis TaxID=1173101 RepID=A0A975MQU0_9GAMM|nr:hypothetical protein [Methylomonas paludis]QWF72301.1 hypothetical protein KEF85_07605 [Methylomonas paludis]